MLGIKRNLMGLLGVILFVLLQALLFVVFAMTPLGVAIPLIVMLMYFIVVNAFTAAYAAYPIIDRYMIEPYRDLNQDEDIE